MDQYLRIPSHKFFFPVVLIAAFVSTVLLLYIGKPEFVPQLWISIVAVLLSYWACTFTADKLRLDLLDRRFEIYSKTLDYCHTVIAYASLEPREENRERINNAIDAAHESFRGIGIHKTRALFGSDIVEHFEQLNRGFAYITVFGRNRLGHENFDAETYWGHVKQTFEAAEKLPDLFKPYIYFGDHKLL